MIVHNDSRKQLALNNLTVKFSNALFNKEEEGSEAAKKYLNDRGVTDDLLRDFQIGWYPPNRTTDNCDENLRGRVIFPIIDEYGDTVTFSGRFPRSEYEGPKYYHETYKKSFFVYGLNSAWPHMLKKGRVLLVEGYLDVIACHKIGIQNVIAIMGTTLTVEMVIKILRFTENLYLFLDGDSAGREATQKIIEEYNEKQKRVAANCIDISDCKYYIDKKYDPDTFIEKYGRKGVDYLLKTAEEKILKEEERKIKADKIIV